MICASRRAHPDLRRLVRGPFPWLPATAPPCRYPSEAHLTDAIRTLTRWKGGQSETGGGSSKDVVFFDNGADVNVQEAAELFDVVTFEKLSKTYHTAFWQC